MQEKKSNELANSLNISIVYFSTSKLVDIIDVQAKGLAGVVFGGRLRRTLYATIDYNEHEHPNAKHFWTWFISLHCNWRRCEGYTFPTIRMEKFDGKTFKLVTQNQRNSVLGRWTTRLIFQLRIPPTHTSNFGILPTQSLFI